MKTSMFTLALLASASVCATEHLSLGGATPGMTRQQVEAAASGPLNCKSPEHPSKPLDATDVDCMNPTDLAHSSILSGTAYNHPISFLYRFRHGRLGAIYVLGLRQNDYTLALSGLVAKFSTPTRVEKFKGRAAAGPQVDNELDAWVDGDNLLELRRFARKHKGAGLWLAAKWYRDEAAKSDEEPAVEN